MTTRKTALTLAKIAGYHDDTASFTRLIIESRVNRQAMNEAFLNGKQAKQNGVKCNCYQCQQERICPRCNSTRNERLAGNAVRCFNCGQEWNLELQTATKP